MTRPVGNLMVVPNAGKVISTASEVPRTKSAIALIPRPDRKADTLPKDILRSLGKRKRAGRLSAQGASPLETACAWLVAEDVTDVLIYDADWLDTGDAITVSDLTEASRVWLLYDGPHDDALIARLSDRDPQIVSPASLEFWMRRRPRATAQEWGRFPQVPLASALTFRGSCANQLDAIDLERIDRLLEAGIDHSAEYFKHHDAITPELLDFVISPTLPLWPALCHLRGLQLGAIWSGFRVEVDLDAWLKFKQARPELSPSVCVALREQADPMDTVLLTAAAISGAKASQLVALNVGALNEACTRFEICGDSYVVPSFLRPATRAFMRLRHPESEAFEPLFAGSTGKRITAGRAGDLVHAAAERAGVNFAMDHGRASRAGGDNLPPPLEMLGVERMAGCRAIQD